MVSPRQEKFSQAIASGSNQSDAYRQAYPDNKSAAKTINEAACRLARNGKVLARVEELRRPAVEAMRYGLMEAMKEAQEAFAVSRDVKSGAAMVAAVALRSKLNGLMVERKEIVLTEVQRLDDESLDRLIALKAVEAGIANLGPTGRVH